MPDELTIPANKVFLSFKAVTSESANGFLVEYTSEEPVYCQTGNELTAPKGIISDGSNSYQYHDNSNCSWYIAPEKESIIRVKFNKLNTELVNDYVRLYDVTNKVIIGEFSGTEIPEDLEVSTNSLTVKFVSNSRIRGEGFELEYDFSTSIQNKEMAKVSVFPNPANATITLVRNNSENCVVRLLNCEGKILTNRTSSSSVIHMNINNLTEGIYIIQVESKKGKVFKKICVQR